MTLHCRPLRGPTGSRRRNSSAFIWLKHQRRSCKILGGSAEAQHETQQGNPSLVTPLQEGGHTFRNAEAMSKLEGRWAEEASARLNLLRGKWIEGPLFVPPTGGSSLHGNALEEPLRLLRSPVSPRHSEGCAPNHRKKESIGKQGTSMACNRSSYMYPTILGQPRSPDKGLRSCVSLSPLASRNKGTPPTKRDLVSPAATEALQDPLCAADEASSMPSGDSIQTVVSGTQDCQKNIQLPAAALEGRLNASRKQFPVRQHTAELQGSAKTNANADALREVDEQKCSREQMLASSSGGERKAASQADCRSPSRSPDHSMPHADSHKKAALRCSQEALPICSTIEREHRYDTCVPTTKPMFAVNEMHALQSPSFEFDRNYTGTPTQHKHVLPNAAPNSKSNRHTRTREHHISKKASDPLMGPIEHIPNSHTNTSNDETYSETSDTRDAGFSSRRQVRQSFITDPRQRLLLTRTNSAEKEKSSQHVHEHEYRREAPRRSSAGSHSLPMFIARSHQQPSHYNTDASYDDNCSETSDKQESAFASRRQARQSFITDPRQRVLFTRTNSAEKEKRIQHADEHEHRRQAPRRSSAGSHSLPMFIARSHQQSSHHDTYASADERPVRSHDTHDAGFSSRRQVRQSFITDPRQRLLLTRTNSAEKEKSSQHAHEHEYRREAPRRSSAGSHSLPMFIARSHQQPSHYNSDASYDEISSVASDKQESAFASRRQARQSFITDPRQRVLFTRTNSAEKEKSSQHAHEHEYRREAPRRSSAGSHSLPMFIARSHQQSSHHDTYASADERPVRSHDTHDAGFSSRRQVRQSFITDPRQRLLLTRTNSAEKEKSSQHVHEHEYRREAPRRSSAGSHSLPMFIARSHQQPSHYNTDASYDDNCSETSDKQESAFASRRQARQSFITDPRQRVLFTRTNSAEKEKRIQHADEHEHRRQAPRRSSAGSHSLPMFIARSHQQSSHHDTYASADERPVRSHDTHDAGFSSRRQVRQSFITDPRQRLLLTRTNSAEKEKSSQHVHEHEYRREAPRRSSAGSHSLPMFIARSHQQPSRYNTDASYDDTCSETSDKQESAFASRRQARQSFITDPRQRVLFTRTNSAEKEKRIQHADEHEHRRQAPRRSSAGSHSLPMFIARSHQQSSHHDTYASADERPVRSHDTHDAGFSSRRQVRQSFITDPRQRLLLTRTNSAEKEKSSQHVHEHEYRREAPRRSSAGSHSLPMFIARSHQQPSRYNTDASYDDTCSETSDKQEPAFASRRQARQSFITDPRQRVLFTRTNSAEKEKRIQHADEHEHRRQAPRRSSAGSHSLPMFIARSHQQSSHHDTYASADERPVRSHDTHDAGFSSRRQVRQSFITDPRQRLLLTRTNSAEKEKSSQHVHEHEYRREAPRRSSAGSHSLPMFIARSHQQPSHYNTDASYDDSCSETSDKQEPAFASRRQARQSFITDPRQRVLFTRTNSAEKEKRIQHADEHEHRRQAPRRSSAGSHSLPMFIARSHQQSSHHDTYASADERPVRSHDTHDAGFSSRRQVRQSFITDPRQRLLLTRTNSAEKEKSSQHVHEHEYRREAPRRSSAGSNSLPMFIARSHQQPSRYNTDTSYDDNCSETSDKQESAFASRRQARQSFITDPRQRVLFTRTNSAEKEKSSQHAHEHEYRRQAPRRSSAGSHSLPMFIARSHQQSSHHDTYASADERPVRSHDTHDAGFSSRRQVRQSFITDPRQRLLLTRTNSAEKEKSSQHVHEHEYRREAPRRSSAGSNSLPMFIARSHQQPSRYNTDTSYDDNCSETSDKQESAFASRRQARQSFITDPRQRVLFTRTNSAEKEKSSQHAHEHEYRRQAPRRSSAGSHSLPMFIARSHQQSSHHDTYASADERPVRSHDTHDAGFSSRRQVRQSFITDPRQRLLLTRTNSAEKEKSSQHAHEHEYRREAPRRSSAGSHSLPMFIARSHQQPSRYNTDASYDDTCSETSDKQESAFASRRQARQSFITDPRQRVLFTRTNSAEKEKRIQHADEHEHRRQAPRRSSAGSHSLPMFIARSHQQSSHHDTYASADERPVRSHDTHDAGFSSRRQVRQSFITDPRQRVLFTRTNSAEKEKSSQHAHEHEYRREAPRRSSAGSHSLPMFIARSHQQSSHHDTYASADERPVRSHDTHDAGFSSRRQVRQSFITDPRQRLLLTRTNSAEKEKSSQHAHEHEYRREAPRRSSAGSHSLPMFIARSHQQPSRYNTDASYDEISSVASDKKEPAFASRRQARESFITDPRQRVLFTRTNSAEKEKRIQHADEHEHRRQAPRRSSAGSHSLPMFVGRFYRQPACEEGERAGENGGVGEHAQTEYMLASQRRATPYGEGGDCMGQLHANHKTSLPTKSYGSGIASNANIDVPKREICSSKARLVPPKSDLGGRTREPDCWHPVRCAAASSRASAPPFSKNPLGHPQVLPKPQTTAAASETTRSNFLRLPKADEGHLDPDAGGAGHAGQQIANFSCQHIPHLYSSRPGCPHFVSYHPGNFYMEPNNYITTEGLPEDVLGCFPLGASQPQPVSGFSGAWAKDPHQPGDFPLQETIVKRSCIDRNYFTETESNSAAAQQLKDTLNPGHSSPINVPQSKQANISEKQGSLPERCDGFTDCNELRTVFYKRGPVDEHAGPSVILEPATRAICFRSPPNPDTGVHYVPKSCRSGATSSEIKPCMHGLADQFAEEHMTNSARQQLWEVTTALPSEQAAKACPDACFNARGPSQMSILANGCSRCSEEDSYYPKERSFDSSTGIPHRGQKPQELPGAGRAFQSKCRTLEERQAHVVNTLPKCQTRSKRTFCRWLQERHHCTELPPTVEDYSSFSDCEATKEVRKECTQTGSAEQHHFTSRQKPNREQLQTPLRESDGTQPSKSHDQPETGLPIRLQPGAPHHEKLGQNGNRLFLKVPIQSPTASDRPARKAHQQQEPPLVQEGARLCQQIRGGQQTMQNQVGVLPHPSTRQQESKKRNGRLSCSPTWRTLSSWNHPLLGPFPSPYSNRRALQHRDTDRSSSCIEKREITGLAGTGLCNIKCSCTNPATASSDSMVKCGCRSKSDCGRVEDTMTGHESNSIDAKPIVEPGVSSEHKKLSAPSGDFWESGNSVSNIRSCGLTATEALTRATAAVRSASADPPSVIGSMALDSACPKECSVAIQISCCPWKFVGGNSCERPSLSGEGLAHSGSALSGGCLQESFKMIEREVQTTRTETGMQEPLSPCISMLQKRPIICLPQRAKVRCFSSPGSLAPASPANAQLFHCLQDEASASPFRKFGGPTNQNPVAESKEANATANECLSRSPAHEPCNSKPISYLGGSSKNIQDEGGIGKAGGCLGTVKQPCNHETSVLPSDSVVPQCCASPKKQDGQEMGDQANKNDLMLKVANNGAERTMIFNDPLSKPPSIPLRSTSKNECHPFESSEATAASKCRVFHGRGLISGDTLAKSREQRDGETMQELQHDYGDLLHPRQGATANTTETGVGMEEYRDGEWEKPRTPPQQQPFESTLDCLRVYPSSPGVPPASLISFELAHLLHGGICSATNTAVVMAHHSPYLPNPLEMGAETTKGDSNAVLLVPGNYEAMKATAPARSYAVTPSGSRLPPLSVLSVSPVHSPRRCRLRHNCIHKEQYFAARSAKVPMNSPQIHRSFYRVQETRYPFQPYSSDAYAAQNTACTSQPLTGSLTVEDVKIACPSSPPSTVTPCPVSQQRAAENPTVPLAVRPNDDTAITMKNERPHQAGMAKSSIRDWGTASDSKELCKPHSSPPQGSKVACCISAKASPQLSVCTGAQHSKDRQGYEVDQGLLNTYKIAGERPEESHPGTAEAQPSAALPYAPPPESPHSKPTHCTSAGRNLATRFLAHIRQGIRFPRRRHRSISAPTVPSTSSVHKRSTEPGGAECEEGMGLPELPLSCALLPPQRGSKNTSTVHESPAGFSSFIFDDGKVGMGHTAAPTRDITSSLYSNSAEAGHSAKRHELAPRGVEHASQSTTPQDPRARDVAKDTLLLEAPVFTASVSHTSFPPTDECSNSHSEDHMPPSGHFREDSASNLPSTKWTTHQKAASPRHSSRQENTMEDTHMATESPSCMLDDSDYWVGATSAGIKHWYPLRETSVFSLQDAQGNGRLHSPPAAASPLDAAAESNKTKGGSRMLLSGRHSMMAELQKWQHLLELNSILQRGRR